MKDNFTVQTIGMFLLWVAMVVALMALIPKR